MDEKSSVIEANLAAIEERISAACRRAGRRREEIRLIAVSKTFPAAAIDAAVAHGVTDIGENRVQELRDKLPGVRLRPERLHLIGHLQTNKARDAARLFDVIHTIDSAELASKVSRHAMSFEKSLEVLIEVNLGREDQKSGVMAEEAEALALAVQKMPALDLRGLMAIPPLGSAEETRPWFAELRRLRDQIRSATGAAQFSELSMGMTDDFEVAVEEGSTMIRVGRAIFGARG
jgi:PLP dependent protein